MRRYHRSCLLAQSHRERKWNKGQKYLHCSVFQHTCFVELWLNYFKRNLRPEFSLDCLLLTAKLTVFHLSFLSRHHCLFCFLEYIDNVATKRFSFSALGRYQEAVNCYQAVKPLNIFHDVCGLALSLFMAGQLKESYHGNWSVSIFFLIRSFP